MAGTSTYDAWNAYLGGKLGKVLGQFREDGLSYEQIARTLYKQHDIDVSRDTVKRWCDKAVAA